jgi:hypothetical protein
MKYNAEIDTATGYFLVSIILLFVAIGPIFTIAALNTVFNTDIPYNIYTWLSFAWLHISIFLSNK